MNKIKVEILLPLKYNDGSNIEGKKYRITYRELIKKFGGCSQEDYTIMGDWIDSIAKKHYKDTNTICWIICDDIQDNMNFLKKLKEDLKERFQQLDLLIYFTKINVI